MYRIDHQGLTVGVVVPALDEALNIADVVQGVLGLCAAGERVVDTLVVCDNGSQDATASLAAAAGAIVVTEPQRGYGAACLRAIEALPADVDVIVFMDGDASMVAGELPTLLDAILAGADLVIGSRRLGARDPRCRVEAGAMTVVQRWGNVFAAALLSLRWRSRVTDLGPFRAVRRSAYRELGMADPAYGWTVEMQAKALRAGLDVREVPVSCLTRRGVSKVSGTWRGTLGASWGILSTIARHAR